MAGNYFNRKVKTRGKPKELILIVCEGEKTEPNYFRKFRVSTSNVKVIGAGALPDKVVERAIKEIEDAKTNRKDKFEHVWCVFDRDDHPEKRIISALNLARKNGIKIAFSNECFELWYILHYQLLNSSLHRSQYYPLLKKKLGKSYKKNDPDMYEILLSHQRTALRNAKSLYDTNPYDLNNQNDFQKAIKANPSTTVYQLVELLNKNI